MAKRYIIYANGKDLATVPVTQNEGGKYYWNGSVYFKPVLGEFDTATPPAGFKAYLGGSHTVYLGNAQRNPIDFSLVAGTVITMNVDVQVLASTLADGSWCKVQIVGTNIILAFVHTYKWASGIVKAGNAICIVAPQSVTGFAPHLHNDDWSGLGRKIRDLILNGDYKDMATFKIGDKIIFTEKQNKRGGAGTGFQDMGAYEVGEIATIKDNPRASQNSLFYGKGSSNKTNDSYTWYDTISSSGQSFWVADMGKFRLATPEEVSPPKPQEPTTPPELVECQSRVKSLEKEIGTLESKLGACEGSRSELVVQKGELEAKANAFELEASQLKSEVSQLEAEVSQLRAEIKKQEEIEKTLDEEVRTWIESYDALYATHNRVVKEKNEAIEELRQERLKECGPFEGIKLLFNKLLKLIRRLGKS